MASCCDLCVTVIQRSTRWVDQDELASKYSFLPLATCTCTQMSLELSWKCVYALFGSFLVATDCSDFIAAYIMGCTSFQYLPWTMELKMNLFHDDNENDCDDDGDDEALGL